MGQGADRWADRGAWVHLVMCLSDCVRETRLELEELNSEGSGLSGGVQRSVRLLEAGEEVIRQAARELEELRASCQV